LIVVSDSMKAKSLAIISSSTLVTGVLIKLYYKVVVGSRL
jgi:hypothetical protein